MFGNRLGWGISAALVLVVGLALWQFIYRPGTEAQPPTAVGQNAEKFTLELSPDPRTLAPFMTEPQSAVELYKQAIAEYEAKRPVLGEPDPRELAKAIDLLVQASKMKGAGVFVDRPGELINYSARRPGLEALKSLGDMAFRLGREAQNAKQPDKARQMYEAMFALGLKLYEERLTYDEMNAGWNLLAVASYLGPLQPTAALQEQYRNFDQHLLPFSTSKIQPPLKAIRVLEPYVGDMIELARNAGDRMWRVEAALALGRCKYLALDMTLGDKVSAKRTLNALAEDQDPFLQLAAQAARDLSVEQFRMLK